MLAPGAAVRTTAAATLQPTLRSLAIRPLAISAAVRDALAFGDPIVRAEHSHGVSLGMRRSEDAIFMSTPGIGLLPAHIVVRARDLERVLDAIDDSDASAFDSGDALTLRLDVEGVRAFRPMLTPRPQSIESAHARANIAAVARWLRASALPLGLGATASELLAPRGRWRKLLVDLHCDSASAARTLRALVGLGAGTTPAGDDFATGVIAHAWATEGWNAPVIAAMRSLEAELPRLTTDAGATYIRAAARGEFGSHLIEWVRALPRVSASRALTLALRVAGHGATSGCDTLVGFIAAAEAQGAARSTALPDRR